MLRLSLQALYVVDVPADNTRTLGTKHALTASHVNPFEYPSELLLLMDCQRR